jgi:hypothetical protein
MSWLPSQQDSAFLFGRRFIKLRRALLLGLFGRKVRVARRRHRCGYGKRLDRALQNFSRDGAQHLNPIDDRSFHSRKEQNSHYQEMRTDNDIEIWVPLEQSPHLYIFAILRVGEIYV